MKSRKSVSTRVNEAPGKALSPSNPPMRFGFLLHDVSRLRRTLFDQRLKPLGITRSQWSVLAQISRAKGEPMAQVELARLLDIGKAALGASVERLERSGYVKRLGSDTDRRVKQVALTEDGRALLKVMERVGQQTNLELTAGISAGELAEFERTLLVMKSKLAELIRLKQ